MRAWPILAVLIVGATCCNLAEAQNTTNLYKNNYGKPVTTPVRQQSSPILSGRFRARDLFQQVFRINNRPTFTPATIPDPNSKEYIESFGFRRVGR